MFNAFWLNSWIFQQSPKLLSPGSGNVSARYVGWSSGMANGGTGGSQIANQKSLPFNKCEDTDSGTGSSSSEAHVIRHIDRNILACQICQHRYKEPKVCNYAFTLKASFSKNVLFLDFCHFWVHCSTFLTRECWNSSCILLSYVPTPLKHAKCSRHVFS